VSDEFLHVYDEHVWDIYGYLAYRLGSRADAEDLTQLTFERAFRAWGKFDPSRASARTWLLAIARNALTDHRRRDRSARTNTIGEGGIDEAALPASEGPEASTGISPELEQALAVLGRRERTVIALRFGGGLKGPEIAEVLGLSVANVQQLMSRALRRLRTELERGEREERLAAGPALGGERTGAGEAEAGHG